MLDAWHEMNATSAAATGEREIGFAMERLLSGSDSDATRSRLSIVLWPLRVTGRSRDQRAKSMIE
jgi:hypothetical protein